MTPDASSRWSCCRFCAAVPFSMALLLALLGPGPSRAQGGIAGSVVDETDRRPRAGVQVVVDDGTAEAVSDEDGRFALSGLPAGTYAVEARLAGFVVQRTDGVAVADGEVTEVAFVLVPAPVSVDQIVVTPSQFTLLRREPGAREFLSGVEIERMPHLSDDLYRALGRLPGVTGGDVSAKFHVRGGEQEELLVLVDGLEVYEPFHLKDFQSVFSILDGEAVGGVDLFTGGFPARYGNRMGGVIDVSTASPPDRRHTELGVSFVNARVLSQGTLGDGKGEWLASARRGYLDVVLDFVDPEGEFDPTYYDALGKLQWGFGKGSTLSINLLAAYDDLLFEGDDDEERADASYGNAYAWLNLGALLSEQALSRTVLSVGKVDRDRRAGLEDDDLVSQARDERDLEVVALRQDLNFQIGGRHYLELGVEARRLEADYDYESHSVFFDPLVTLGGPPVVVDRSVDLSPEGESYGAYVSDRVLLGSSFAVELGVRWDRQTYLATEDDQVSPRINLLYRVGDRTNLRAGWGRFHQSQHIHELQVEDGVSTFFPAQRSDHQLLALEHSFRGGLNLRLEAYRKEITDVRPRFENLFDPIEILPEAEGDRTLIAPERAEAEGLEVTLRRSGAGPFSWWANYTWSSAEDRVDGEWIPRGWDQPHAVSFSLNYRKGEKWNFNLSGVYHTGWPTTRVTATLEEGPDGDLRIVPRIGPRNDERFSDFHRLDFRASRKVRAGDRSFTFFLEVLNLYNRENPCCVDDFRYVPQSDGSVTVQRIEDFWLPIIPSFGLTWTF